MMMPMDALLVRRWCAPMASSMALRRCDNSSSTVRLKLHSSNKSNNSSSTVRLEVRRECYREEEARQAVWILLLLCVGR